MNDYTTFVARFYDATGELVIDWTPFSADNLAQAYQKANYAVICAQPGSTLALAAHVEVKPSEQP